MKKILYAFLILASTALIGCGQSSIDGEYKNLSGKVGIYEMKSMSVKKSSEGSKYSVTFSGDEKNLSYQNVEYKDGSLNINDKGFMLPVKIEGNKATVTQGGAIFEKVTK